jgi:hypothetical protein
VALQDAWVANGKELEERAALANDNEARVAIIQQCLVKALHQHSPADKTVSYCLGRPICIKDNSLQASLPIKQA